MKKKIVGIVSAALLFGSTIGYAASSSLIGAKVQGVYTIQKADGTKIADAVIINGSAYAPVRAVSEVTGTSLSIEGKTIIMGTTVETSQSIGGSAQVEPIATAAPAATLTQEEKDMLTSRITNAERTIAGTQEDIAQTKAKLATSTDAAEIEKLTKTIKELEARVAGTQKSVDADKARLSAGQ